MKQKEVVVVGAGFTGLVTAYYLAKKDFQVSVYEEKPEVGGLIHSHRRSEGLVETAANGLMLNEAVAELFAELGIPYLQTLRSSRRRFIFRGKIRRWPLGWSETFGLCARFLGRVLFRKSSLHPKPQETVAQWGRRCLGATGLRYLLAPALQGIYAGNPEALSAETILGPFWNPNRPKTKLRGTVTPPDGMGQLLRTLETKLLGKGVKIFKNHKYEITNLEIPIVVCTSVRAAAALTKKAAPDISAALGKIPVLPLVSVTVFPKDEFPALEGFGCIFPDDQGFQALGVLSNTRIFPDRGPAMSETWIFGGARNPDWVLASQEGLLEQIRIERRILYRNPDLQTEFRAAEFSYWPQALPYYTLEHKALVDSLSLPKNLFLNGNYLGVLGLAKILLRSRELAEKLAVGGAT